MADVFVTVPGTVAVYEDLGAQLPGRIRFEDSESLRLMISGLDYKQAVDAQ